MVYVCNKLSVVVVQQRIRKNSEDPKHSQQKTGWTGPDKIIK